ESPGEARAPRTPPHAGEDLLVEGRVVGRGEQVRESEVTAVLVDGDEKGIKQGIRRVDVVPTELVEGLMCRRIDTRDVHSGVLVQLERFLERGRVSLHFVGERGDAYSLLGDPVVGRRETREVEALHEEA